MHALALFLAAGVGHGAIGGVWGDAVGGGAAVAARRGSSAVTITITVPSASPEGASTTPETVSGTTTGTITGVTWATACVAGPTACTTGAGTFSCSVTQSSACAASQTVTVSANSDVATDTTVLNFPLFEWEPDNTTSTATGPSKLNDTLGSTGASIVVSCNLNAGTATEMVCTGKTFGVNGTPNIDELGPWTDGNQAVAFTNNARYDADDTTTGDITTEDIALEVVALWNSNGDGAVGKKADPVSGASAGWSIGCAGSACIPRMAIGDGTDAVTISAPSAGNGWAHVLCFVDRSSATGGQCFTNGTAGTAVSVTAVAETITNGLGMAIGANDDAETSTEWNNYISVVRLWKCTDCLSTSGYQAIATDRASKLLGLQPSLAVGTVQPPTMTRASSGYFDMIQGNERFIFIGGNHWMRIGRRGASSTPYEGFLSEPTTTNLVLQSEVLGTTWTAINLSAVNTNEKQPPWIVISTSTLVGDGVDCPTLGGECGVTQEVGLTAATHTFSIFAQAEAHSCVALRDADVANAIAYFSLTNCAACDVEDADCAAAVLSAAAGVSRTSAVRYPIDTGDDGVVDANWCRVAITFEGTAATHTMDVLACDGDGDITIAADVDATSNFYASGAEIEAMPYQTSYQATTTATVTRNGDDLRFNAADGNAAASGTMEASFLCHSYDNASNGSILSLTVDATNHYDALVQSTGDLGLTEGTVTSTQWSIADDAGDISDATTHTTRTTYTTNDVRLYVDGTAASTTDTTATMLSSLTGAVLRPGANVSAAAQVGCIIRRVRVWDTPWTPTQTP